MALPSVSNQVPRRSNLIAIAVVAMFAIAAVFLTRPQTSVGALSPVSGLVALRATAQVATPYTQAMTNPSPTLIEFYADWCTTCQAMAPTLEAVHTQFGDRVNIVMLDIDNPQWASQVRQFRVNGVPHLALVQADQTLVDTWIGKVPKRVLTQRIAELLG